MDFVTLALLFVIVIILALIIRGSRRSLPPPPDKYELGDVTLEALRFYNGYDWSKPPLVAIRGKVYDVSNKYDVYGPGKPKSAYTGREIARALALESINEKDFTADLTGLTAEQLERLEQSVQEFERLHDHVGQVVPLRKFTAEELARHDGTDNSLPLYLSIKGTVYDITKGKQFYGPDGVYPFAGKEVARAFALFSTELEDCNDNLEGLSYTELENLRDWIGKFNSKYPIVGRLVLS
ncbi:hypothetical protein VaNZ11_002711 [Volvox africanus]|uniref:Cytochrome b5 heme-binding domain-containing protein n=1 Tax=Volvox africanus TaxID=51714 RepID=A0ABQ5RTI9_9CHLO|nr:hypothetical protein VaNZ11_002711 [Volvox africanus]